MKEYWLPKNECTACNACYNICPVNAINMIEDDCGFKYPSINENCINCNLCEKVCNDRKTFPVIDKPKVYVAWSKDEKTRHYSTSGGSFSEFAKYVLKNNGVVVGAAYNSENLVEHIMIDNIQDLEKVAQSKYLESDIRNIFKAVKEKLEKNVLVLFCGTPCQVSGLSAYLKNKNYPNLLLIDFICRGINSRKAYKSWLGEVETINNSKAIKVWFKYKENGWKASPKCTKVTFENNTEVVLNGKENLYMCEYLNTHIYTRPSCSNCDFKGYNRHADVMLADFWGIEKEYDDDKGTSVIWLNSEKGKQYFDKIKDNVFFLEKTVEDVTNGNGALFNSIPVNKKTQDFLKSLDNMKFSSAIKKYCESTLLEKCIKFPRRVASKIKRTILN